MSTARHHAEWLSLVEVSGPFLSMPVLMRVFPQGLIAHDPDLHRDLKMAFSEWEDSQEGYRANRALHLAWIKFVLTKVLDLPEEVISEGQKIQQTLHHDKREYDEDLKPDLVIVNPPGRSNAGKARLLVQVYPASQDLEHPVSGHTWKASPDTRMMELLHATNVRLGLVTNGERWMLVNAKRNETTGYASWYSTLWIEEPITLRAFRSLLGMERFFNVPDGDTLEAMLDESAQNQQDVTDQLGYQVRRAVEVLIESLDQADQDHGRKLLGNIPETELYESALTVMMRLVFLFCAEERGLMLLEDEIYADNYAVSTLQAQLREAADQHGEEILERRHDAWCRLISTFRAVYGGISHDRLKMPAYSGHLFDPDRFAFLEGRKQGTTWKDTAADPLPVNNRTVLHLLEALQYLQIKMPGGGPAESRRLSFRALGIEQIGHVYEGLLDHTAKRATEPILGLLGTKNKEPEIPLAKLEGLNGGTEEAKNKLLEFLKEKTNKSESALKKALALELKADEASRFQAACGNDPQLWARVKPFAGLIRNDSFGHPVAIPMGSVYVTEGTDRRSSGTHYTPTSLTEPIVRYTLEPLVFVGPAEGKPENEWKLRSPKELLELKICDMACGSGAFLVQACRYMAERLMEAWDVTDKLHPDAPGITPFGEVSTGSPGEMLIPKDTAERVIYARRIIAQRCLYGVDKNPLAAEMAKLSLWLLTLQKNKPFTFLDHAIRSGDSLVGIANTHQLTSFSLDGEGIDRPIFTDPIKKRLDAVRMLRRQIAELADNSAEDVERKTLMLQNADQQTQRLAYAANLLLAACWESTSNTDREVRLKHALVQVEHNFKDLPVEELEAEGKQRLQKAGCPKPFHWPLEFPEVFMQRGGFDAIVGNPPFAGGRKLRGLLGGDYFNWLTKVKYANSRGNADICVYFFLNAFHLVNRSGSLGIVATTALAEGDSRETGLDKVIQEGGSIYRANTSRVWPGTASVTFAMIWVSQSRWQGRTFLDEVAVSAITPSLVEESITLGSPNELVSNDGMAFQGSIINGTGFILTKEEANHILALDRRYKEVVYPYMTGQDLNISPTHTPTQWVVNFFEWPLDRSSADKEYKGPVAADYPACLAILQERVREERLSKSEEVAKAPWWQFWRCRNALYEALRGKQWVLAIATAATKYVAFAKTSPSMVFSHSVAIVVTDSFSDYAILSSEIYEAWARANASYNLSLLRYTISDCFNTFPFPQPTSSVEQNGIRFCDKLYAVIEGRGEGLTKTYNRFHNPDETTEDLQKLRDLHVEMDNAVAAAYGWTNLDLGHGFHETKQGLRFTISEPARREVLARLLKLNHERYAEEVAQGLHEKKGGGKGKGGKGKGRKKKAKKQTEDDGLTLPGFNDDSDGETT